MSARPHEEDPLLRRRLLAMLQLADSALPIGRFVYSHGLEQWLADCPGAAPEAIAELVAVAVRTAFAPLDGVLLAHAHRTRSLAELVVLDDLLTAHKLAPGARRSSEACGQRLARLAPSLVDDALVRALAEAVGSGQARGNLAIVEGVVARAQGIPLEAALLVSLRESAVGLLSAAVRMGALTPSGAQAIQVDLRGTIMHAAALAAERSLADVSSSALELEASLLAHARADSRQFAT